MQFSGFSLVNSANCESYVEMTLSEINKEIKKGIERIEAYYRNGYLSEKEYERLIRLYGGSYNGIKGDKKG